MKRKRRIFSTDFKLKVILDTLKERESLSQLAQRYDLHPNQISKWKNDFLENAKGHMRPTDKESKDRLEQQVNKLYIKIGQLQIENDFLKKKLF